VPLARRCISITSLSRPGWRGHRVFWLLFVSAALAISAVTGWAAPAGAVDFHGYAVFQVKAAGVLSAVSVTRRDEAIKVAGTSNCMVKFTGQPVYQTEWIGNEAGNWVELGTAHQCKGYQFWYAGYGSGGTWFPVWTRVVTTHGSHKFWIRGVGSPSGKLYTFNIDGNRRTSIIDGLGASVGQTGLESYASATTVPAYAMTVLKYSTGYRRTWQNWVHTALAGVPTSPLCGKVVTATRVVAAENVKCAATATVTAAAPVRLRPLNAATALAAGPLAPITLASSAACAAARRAWDARSVAHAYQSTAGGVRAWRQTRLAGARPGYGPLARTATARVAVCYLAGQFTSLPAAPGRSGGYQRLIVLVNEATGAMTLDAAAPAAAAWSFAPPRAGR
jgi:hypothetical protein